jgi:hypothetical protein
LSSLSASAVKTWVPSGWSGCSNVTGHVEHRVEALAHEQLAFLAADEDRDRAGLERPQLVDVVLVAVLATRGLPAAAASDPARSPRLARRTDRVGHGVERTVTGLAASHGDLLASDAVVLPMPG